MADLPCNECRGKCCTYPVFTKREFKTVKSVHGLPKDTIVQKFEHVASYNHKVKRGDPGIMIHLADGTCPYLKNGACSIYPLRPKICKDYGVVPTLPCQYLYPEESKRFHDERLKRFMSPKEEG